MNKDVESLLEKATAVRLNAYAPYSNFLVGACIETMNGKNFSACNVENASYGLGICAESHAVGAMLAAGENNIKQIVIIVKGPGVSAPCGACRQRLNEFATPETLIHLFDLEGNTATYTLEKLLPYAFGPHDLLLTR
jgi:cytidine deaminase